MSINIGTSGSGRTGGQDNSRYLKAHFRGFVEEKVQPIYTAIIDYSNQLQQQATLTLAQLGTCYRPQTRKPRHPDHRDQYRLSEST